MLYLRQSTASQEALLGPALDDTDGKTAETGLTIANTDIKLWKAGATTEADKNSGGGTHVAGGRYSVVFDATDTDTLGSGEANCHVAGALPMKIKFCVLPANVFDALILGSDLLQIDVQQILGAEAETTTTQDDIKATTDKLETMLAADGANYKLTAGALQEAPGITGDVTLAASQPNYAPATAAALGTPAGASIAADLADLHTHVGTVITGVNVTSWKGSTAPAMTGDAYARLGAPAGASIAADIVDLHTHIGTVITGVNVTSWKGATAPAMTGDSYARLGAPAGASIAADIAAVSGGGGIPDGAAAYVYGPAYALGTTTPLDGVEVIASTDALMANVVARQWTDETGYCTLVLDLGTHYLWRSKNGYSFTNPLSVEVV